MAFVASTMIRPLQSATRSASPWTASNGTARITTSAASASDNSAGSTCGPISSTRRATASTPRAFETRTGTSMRANAQATAEPMFPEPMIE